MGRRLVLVGMLSRRTYHFVGTDRAAAPCDLAEAVSKERSCRCSPLAVVVVGIHSPDYRSADDPHTSHRPIAGTPRGSNRSHRTVGCTDHCIAQAVGRAAAPLAGNIDAVGMPLRLALDRRSYQDGRR